MTCEAIKVTRLGESKSPQSRFPYYSAMNFQMFSFLQADLEGQELAVSKGSMNGVSVGQKGRAL